ncbi:GtrA family protein [Paenibacillus sp. LjRoot153]|uniref:GtrA family protein n=1 Tax=Paenibacillus sp. LjRoot153 TaxID=3342270 RepID=UPI003F4FA3CC
MKVEKGLHLLLMRFLTKTFMKFLIVGLANTSSTYTLYLLLLIYLPYTYAYTVSYLVGILFSYLLNSLMVFKQALSLKKFFEFPIVYVVQYIFNTAILLLLVENLHFNEKLSLIISICVTFPVTYLLSKKVLTKPSK